MSESTETGLAVEAEAPYLIGVRLREPAMAEDYLTAETDLHVGDFCVVEGENGNPVGEVRRPRRPLPGFRRDRLSRKGPGRGAEAGGSEMKQIGARDTTKLMDGIGPCGRQLCCTAHLRRFEPISVKMAKTQDMPLTDSRLLGNCGRPKC